MGRIVCCMCGQVLQENVPGLTGDSHGYCKPHFDEAMAAVEDRIQRPLTYRPAGQGVTCDACEENPKRNVDPTAPYLLRCRCHATDIITIKTTLEVAQLKRCPRHARELRERAANGGTFEIVGDQPLKAVA